MNFRSYLPLLCSFIFVLAACDTNQAPEKSESELVPIAQVKTTKLQYSDISATLTAYGTVTALPNTLKSLSVPYACRIENVFVSIGQSIHTGDALITVQPSEDALLVVKQAHQELSAALQELKLLQERMQLKLATQHDLITSQLRVDQAKALVQDLSARGSLKSHILKAEHNGVVTLINVQLGQRILAGSPLLLWTEQNQWNILLGIEPSAVDQLQVHQKVLLSPMSHKIKQDIEGSIDTISQQIDPITHLVNILVKSPASQAFLLNEGIKGQITLSTKRALVVPKTAVLPEDEGFTVFTVVNRHALRHRVQVGIETDTHIEVISETLNAQDDIVVLGNYELKDGMAVEVQKP